MFFRPGFIRLKREYLAAGMYPEHHLTKGVKSLDQRIDIDKFVKEKQGEIEYLVNTALNRAGDVIKRKVADGEIQANIQEVLPLLLYEVLITNTVAVLRLVSEMLEEQGNFEQHRMDH